MHLVVYTSEYVEQPESIDTVLMRITDSSKRNNLKRGITGVLFYLNGRFLQIIEGQENNINELIDIIQKDTRHKNIEYFIDTAVENRSFKDWHMDSFILGQGQLFNKDTLRDLTDSFEKNFLPRANILAYFYKALLQEKAA
jgi:hypothetical protein